MALSEGRGWRAASVFISRGATGLRPPKGHMETVNNFGFGPQAGEGSLPRRCILTERCDRIHAKIRHVCATPPIPNPEPLTPSFAGRRTSLTRPNGVVAQTSAFEVCGSS